MNDRKDDSKRVGIWIRVATEAQVQSGAPEAHERLGRACAEARGWTVVEVYRLNAVPGEMVKNHPETKRMLEGIQSGHITGLIFQKLEQLARTPDELIYFADHFRDAGTDLVSLDGAIDTTTPAGRITYTAYMTKLALEREVVAEPRSGSV